MGWLARTLLYFVAGGLVGFLVLGEFALATFLPVLAGLLILAVLSLVGGLRRQPALSAWSVFLLAAMVVPLMIDGRVVGLPRCTEVLAGVACVGGTRDYQSPFWIELVIFAVAVLGSTLHLRTIRRPAGPNPRP
jgi:hypothetical protein